MLLPTLSYSFMSSVSWVTLFAVTKGYGTLFLCFLGIRPYSCDADMLKKLLSSQFVSGNVIFMSFGFSSRNLLSFKLDNCNDLFLLSCFFVRSVSVCVPDPDLSDNGSDPFTYFYLFFLFQLNQNLLYSLKFLFSAIFFSWILSSVESIIGNFIFILIFVYSGYPIE